MDNFIDPDEEEEYNFIYDFIEEHGVEFYRAREQIKKPRSNTKRSFML